MAEPKSALTQIKPGYVYECTCGTAVFNGTMVQGGSMRVYDAKAVADPTSEGVFILATEAKHPGRTLTTLVADCPDAVNRLAYRPHAVICEGEQRRELAAIQRLARAL